MDLRDVVSAAAASSAGPGTLTILDTAARAVTVPWASVHTRARRLATVLCSAGAAAGMRVGLLADTSVELFITIQASWIAGASVTVLPAPVRCADAEYLAHLRRIVRDARLGLLLVDQEYETVGPSLRGEVALAPVRSLLDQAALAQPAPVTVPAPADLALLQYTSGSTRVPRGVPVTHAHLAANLAGIAAAVGHHAGTRMFSWLPAYHDMGLIGYLVLPMATGCDLVTQPPRAFAARPASWLEGVSRYRATSTASPNFGFALATRSLAGAPAGTLDLGSLELLLCAGEPISPPTMDAFTAATARHALPPGALTTAYGLAEATLAVTFGRGMHMDTVDPTQLESRNRAVVAAGGRRLVRLGTPVTGTTVRVVDPAGVPLRERRVGEVQVSGPGVVGRYWGEAPPTSPWLSTGDLGYLAEGELVVCGRAKDMLFAAGRNIFPQDIEWIAATVEGVRAGNVAAFGIPGHDGDRLVVAVESRAGHQRSVTDGVRAVVAAGIGLRPFDVVVLPPGRLPKTSSGKLRRAATREQYLTGKLEEQCA